ncbi:MAG: CinA family nicotinamide mononucleotide deamidase-related protein [Actinomycetota bacterium]
MIVEVIAVGTELLLGQITNSNASHIGRRLAEEGFDSHYQVTVGDNLARLTHAISTALERADAVILTGGIGPTQDDLTREAICAATGARLSRHEEHAAWIHRRITSQGRPVRENQLRMADLPEGADPVPNPAGVALGVAMEHSGKLIFALPGVPAEMKAMLDETVFPRLRTRAGGPRVVLSRVLKTWGEGESTVADLLGDLYESSNPSVAFLIKDMEVYVRVTAAADDREEALALIEPMEKEVRNRLGDLVFGADDDTVESAVVGALTRRGWTLGTVEGATLGGIGARIASLPEAEPLFRGTVIAPAGGPGPDRPRADVVLVVGEARSEDGDEPRLTREVTMTLHHPEGVESRSYRFGGDDERLRAFATLAGLHLIRLGLT